MDLEEMKLDLQTQLQEIQNSQMQMQTFLESMSNTGQTSERESLKEFVFKMQDDLNRNNAKRLSESVAQISEAIETAVTGATDKSTARISTAEKSFLETVKNAKKEIAEAVREQRKAIFTSWGTCLGLVLIGGMCFCLGAFWWDYCRIKKELLNDLAIERIQKDAVAEYKKELIEDRDEINKIIEAHNARIEAKKK